MLAAELTHREQQIVEMISAGLGSKEIARRLGCATGTVETHVKRLRLKFGARTRAEAAAIWQRRQQGIEARIFDEVAYPESGTQNRVPNFGDYPATRRQG